MSITRWTVHPEATALVAEYVDRARRGSAEIQKFETRLLGDTSTHLDDWLDHIVVSLDEAEARASGFEPFPVVDGPAIWRHPEALLPALVPREMNGSVTLGLRVDSVEEAAKALNPATEVVGSPCARYRAIEIFEEHDYRLLAVERRAWEVGVMESKSKTSAVAARREARRKWQNRQRRGDAQEVIQIATELASQLVDTVGVDVAGACAMDCEREYWQSRNHIAQLQHNRAEMLGLGWGNHDHYTFRSSRDVFPDLLHCFEMLGFQTRERFHAGTEAGWGAQVLEHPGNGYVIFADVDLTPEELEVDFTKTLGGESGLGTVGLWCALHGESIAEAGLHHLAARFDFDRFRTDLQVGHMKPFSELPFLHQAFTEAESWMVEPERLDYLANLGVLNTETEQRFVVQGAAGSHLENIARADGYKGFNQKNVSKTIQATDPRILSVDADQGGD